MTPIVDLYYDFRSPYGYLAFVQLSRLEVDLAVKPIRVVELMRRVGNTPTTITCAAKGRYARTDLGRWAGRIGIGLRPADMRLVDGDACARAVLCARDAGEACAITSALYRAVWSEGVALPGAGEIIAALERAGMATKAIADAIDAPGTTAALEALTQEAADRGVFGSPTMFLGDEMFFGNDRIDFLRDALDGREKAA